jgi:hypothetical protein
MMQLGRTLGPDWGKCCDPKLGRGVTQLKCQRQWDALPVATSTGRAAKLVAITIRPASSRVDSHKRCGKSL